MQTPTRQDFRDLLELAAPVAAVQVGLMAMGLVDAAMVGRLSPEALGAVAVANVWFFVVSTIGMGCMYALDPIISQAHGAGDQAGVALGLQRGLVIALLISLPTTLALALAEPLFEVAGQAPALVPLAGDYTRWMLASVFPYFGFLALRQTLQSLGVVRPILVVILAANLLNAALNWLLIYGYGGIPALGVRGAALATTIGRWAMCFGLAGLTWRRLGSYLRPIRPETYRAEPLGRTLAIGVPIGLQILLEFGVFGLVGLLLGRVGVAAVAGHQVALNYASITFMVPLGIGAAAASLVGRAVGARDVDRARRVAVAALIVGATFMVMTATLLIGIPGWLASLYSPDPGVIAMAAALIPLAGLFQVFDGTQAVAMGVLRGIGDTRLPIVVNLIGYYAVGLPVGLYLAFTVGWGARGLWLGLVAGLAVVAVALVARVRSRMRREIGRVQIDAIG